MANNPSAIKNGAMLIINGSALSINPASYKIDLQDIDSAEATRSADGTMIRDRLCGADTAKRKLEMSWENVNGSFAQELVTAIKDEFFEVTYLDPYNLAWRTGTFYAGDRKMEMLHANRNGNGVFFKKLTVNFIEK